MSDVFLVIVPWSAEAVPEMDSVAELKDWVETEFSPDEIKMESSPKPQLIISGEVDHKLICPRCGTDRTNDLFDLFSDAYADEGFDLDVMAPCGAGPMRLDDIRFTFEGDTNNDLHTGAFARWSMSLMNPSRIPSSKDLDEASKRLRMPSKFVTVHL